jgi:hypothetical protein
MRSAKVCGGDWKRTVLAAYSAIRSPEIKAITKAYPKTVKQWGNEGAEDFNRAVMLHGIASASRYKAKTRFLTPALECARGELSPRSIFADYRNPRPSKSAVPYGRICELMSPTIEARPERVSALLLVAC